MGSASISIVAAALVEALISASPLHLNPHQHQHLRVVLGLVEATPWCSVLLPVLNNVNIIVGKRESVGPRLKNLTSGGALDQN